MKWAKYVSSSGTGCGGGVTAWTCTVLDASTSAGTDISIAFDPNGNADISSYDAAAKTLRIAQYVTSGGTGCGASGSSAWNCSVVDSGGGDDTGHNTSINFDVAGNAWIAYRDTTAKTLRVARYVSSGGTGCGTVTSWTCTTVDSTSANTGTAASIAFDGNGVAWIAYHDTTNGTLRVAQINRGGEILASPGLGGNANKASITTSHADMTSVTDTTNQANANCINSSATWNNGVWAESSEINGLSLPTGSTTAQCTEVAFMIDTTQAISSDTYRFVVATKDGWRADQQPWRGPISVASGAYPALTMESATAQRYSKGNLIDFPSCTTTSTPGNSAAWGCDKIVGTAVNGGTASIAFSPTGTPWISYQNTTSTESLMVAQYVGGSGGSGCTDTAWTCTTIDSGALAGSSKQSMAFDPAGNPWLAYYDGTNKKLKVAQYVGSGGSGCASSAWTCTIVDGTSTDMGKWDSLVMGLRGDPWISYWDATNNYLRVSHYVGSGGSGCTSSAWTCLNVASSAGKYTSIALDTAGNPWISYDYAGSMEATYVAHYVGTGGSGCVNDTWSCINVMTSGSVNLAQETSIAIGSNNLPWVTFYDQQNTVWVAKYKGTGVGSGTCSSRFGNGSSADWDCAALLTANSPTSGLVPGAYETMSLDSNGNPWFTYSTASGRSVAQYVGSGGTGCYTGVNSVTSGTWQCGTIIDSYTPDSYPSIAFDRSGTPWIAYTHTGSAPIGDLYVAKLKLPPNKPSNQIVTAPHNRNGGFGDLPYHLDFGRSPRTQQGACSSTANYTGYCGAGSVDGNVDSMVANTNETPMYYFDNRVSSNAAVNPFTWTGSSTVAPSSSNFTLQIYRFGTTNAWETISPSTNTCSSAAANTSCTITGTPSGTTSEYFEADGSNYWNYFRIYQASSASAKTMRTDAVDFANNQSPNTPSSLGQYDSTGTTSIGTGNWIGSTTLQFKATVSDQDSNDTDYLCVEVEPLGTSFTNANTGCGTTGYTYSGTAGTATVNISGLSTNTQYHWQARTKDAGGLYSSWTSYGGNAESASDFGVDTTAPVTTGVTVYDGTTVGVESTFNNSSLTTLSANWTSFSDGSGSGISSYSYEIGTTAGAGDILTWTSNGASTSVTASGLSLMSSQSYYVSVRATDVAGNVSSNVTSSGQYVAPTLTFSVGNTSITFGNLDASNSYTASASTTLTTSTNAHNGYVITAYLSQQMTNGSATIPGFNGGTYAAPNAWQAGNTGLGYTSSDTSVQGSNIFQPVTCLGGATMAAPGCFAPFSTSAPGSIVADHTAAVVGSAVVNEQFTLTMRITASQTQAAGVYHGTLVLDAVAQF